MNRLTSEERAFIVVSLATYARPSEIRADLLTRFGVDVSEQLICSYDPGTVNGKALSAKWRLLFAETRKAFLRETSKIAVSHRAYRLRQLQEMADGAKAMRNYGLAASLLEQAAKEMGGYYTNRRVLVPGDPIKELAGIFGLPESEVASLLADSPD